MCQTKRNQMATSIRIVFEAEPSRRSPLLYIQVHGSRPDGTKTTGRRCGYCTAATPTRRPTLRHRVEPVLDPLTGGFNNMTLSESGVFYIIFEIISARFLWIFFVYDARARMSAKSSAVAGQLGASASRS